MLVNFDSLKTILNGVKVYVDELIKEITDNLSVVARPNWNQNDSTGEGYIKNRPFYITKEPSEKVEEIVILPETTIALNNGMAEMENTYGFTLELGNTYNVKYNGTIYNNLIANELSGLLALGATDFSLKDYPFLIGQGILEGTNVLAVITSSEANSCTLQITTIGTVKDFGEMYIDSRYEPHLQSNWLEEDESKIGYIKNKPFGTKMVEKSLLTIDNALFEYIEQAGVSMLSDSEIEPIFFGQLNSSDSYTVIWDGIVYENLKLQYYDGAFYMGAEINFTESTYDFTNCPFLLFFIEEEIGVYYFQVGTNSQAERHSFSLTALCEDVTKIPQKYENPVDWDEMDETSGAYIANKPFDEYKNGSATMIYNNSDIYDVSYNSANCYGCIDVKIPLKIGETYSVYIDNVRCPSITTLDEGNICIKSREGASHSFYIYNYGKDGKNTVRFSLDGSYSDDTLPSITIYGAKYDIQPLNERFIPDSIKKEWNGYSLEVVTDLPSVTDDKTFYVILES